MAAATCLYSAEEVKSCFETLLQMYDYDNLKPNSFFDLTSLLI